MNTLLRHINHMLLADGFAAVDGLGVFVLNSRSAAVNANGSISAPFRYVSFEAGAPADNAAVVTSIAHAESISSDEASAKLLASLAVLHDTLAHGVHVPLGNLGTLYARPDNGTLAFDAENVSWYKTLDIAPIELAETTYAADSEDEMLRRRRETFARYLRRTASSAAAIALVAVIAFVMAHMPEHEKSVPQMASMGIEKIQGNTSDETVLDISGQAQASKSALVLILNTPADGSAPAKIRHRQLVEEVVETNDAPARYCLIVASLATQKDAEKFIAAHSTTEMPLRLLSEQGRWRVYALSAPTLDELNVAARNLGVYDAYPSAWAFSR
ncbi:MAG: hypothetical protein OSJ37_07075 [Muribaculaceae bacterium]|jgi:hypothetical protein|nr:hypothetical protein [Muribaculaceae bacterium]